MSTLKTPRPDSRRSRKASKRVPGLEQRWAKKIIFFTKRFLAYDTKVLLKSWIEFYSHVLKHEGELQACKRSKDIYNIALRYAAGIKFEPITYMRSDKDGVPLVIKEFKPYLRGSIDAQRAALTVLQSYRLYKPKGQYSLESIVAPYRGKQDLAWLELYVAIAVKQLPQLQSKLRPGLHITGSNGPNGPALGTAYIDREAIRASDFEDSIKELAFLTGNEPLIGLLDSTEYPADEMLIHRNGRVPIHSKLSIKIESGGKARPFAIVDYFSQCALKPIHDVLMDYLSNHPCDGSSNHSDAAYAVKEWTRTGTNVWSFDLTDATNRFPRFLETICMQIMFGPEISRHWENIISNRKFMSPDGQEVMFNCGQPLGALSSWASFTVAHHILVQTAAHLAFAKDAGRPNLSKIRFFKHYRLVGDDNTIARYPSVASWYRGLLNDIDVDISLSKSVVPSDCSTGSSVGELAKRVFLNGTELTPLPPTAILDGLQPYRLRNLLNDCWNRGYGSSGSPYPVQSIHLSPGEWAALTWPGPGAPPLIQGVRSLLGLYGHNPQDLPAGLKSGWYYWVDIPIEDLDDFMREYLLHKLKTASDQTEEMLNQIQYPLLGSVNFQGSRPIRWGRDWKPKANQCHPEILLGITDWVREEVNRAYEEVYSIKGLYNRGCQDLNRFIGRLHRFFEPRLLIEGRVATRDEKNLTKTFMAKAIKEAVKLRNSGRLPSDTVFPPG